MFCCRWHLHLKLSFFVGLVGWGFFTYLDKVSEQGEEGQSQLSVAKRGAFWLSSSFWLRGESSHGRNLCRNKSDAMKLCLPVPAAPAAGFAPAHLTSRLSSS